MVERTEELIEELAELVLSPELNERDRKEIGADVRGILGQIGPMSGGDAWRWFSFAINFADVCDLDLRGLNFDTVADYVEACDEPVGCVAVVEFLAVYAPEILVRRAEERVPDHPKAPVWAYGLAEVRRLQS